MQEKLSLLLTATIEVHNKDLVKRNDTLVRLSDYEGALRLWLNKQKTLKKIIFAENSGYSLESLKKIAEEENPQRIDVEFISVPPTPGGDVNIGLGELSIIEFALSHSRLLQTSSHFLKVTGRVFIKNIDQMIQTFPIEFHMISFFSENLNYVDSVIVGFHTQCYQERIGNEAKEQMIHPNGRMDFERALAKAFHKAIANDFRWYPFSIIPVVCGMSGTKNTSYTKKYNSFYSLYRTTLSKIHYLFTRTVHDGRHERKHLLERWEIKPLNFIPKSANTTQTTEHDKLGFIDALDVISNKDADKRSKLTALQHINRYRFANKYIKGSNVLDVACGVGYGSSLLNRANTYKGVDLDMGAIEKAVKKYEKTKSIKFILGNAWKIDEFLGKEQFDAIVSFETIEHFREYDRFLDVVFKALKPGGIFIVSTPNREITNAGKTFFDPPKWEHHAQEWTESEFKDLLKNHHFEILGVWGQSFIMKNKIAYIFRGSRRLLKTITQRVLPSRILRFFARPNYIIVKAIKR